MEESELEDIAGSCPHLEVLLSARNAVGILKVAAYQAPTSALSLLDRHQPMPAWRMVSEVGLRRPVLAAGRAASAYFRVLARRRLGPARPRRVASAYLRVLA